MERARQLVKLLKENASPGDGVEALNYRFLLHSSESEELSDDPRTLLS